MRRLTKSALDVLALIGILPIWAVYFLSTCLMSKENAFPGFSQAMSLIPGFSGVYFRRAFYRLVFPQCDSNACISFGTVFSHPTASLGKTAYIGIGCMIGDVTIEEDVLVGSHVSIINGSRQHGIERLDIPVREQSGEFPRITIGRDTWIGDRAIVMADIGKHCVIGAGAIVTKPIEDYAIAVGNPARVIGSRRTDAAGT
jgi:virginiamycin A acetyltransferase